MTKHPYKNMDSEEPVVTPHADDCLTMAKWCAMLMGTIVGSFLEGAVLGLFYILSVKEEFYVNGIGKLTAIQLRTLIVFVFCFMTALMAVAVCNLLKNLVWGIFASTLDESADADTKKALKRLMRKIMIYVDILYCFGCVTGMTGAWCVTYIVLGMAKDLMQSSWVIFFSLFYWLIVFLTAEKCDEAEAAKEEREEMEKSGMDAPAVEMAVPLLEE